MRVYRLPYPPSVNKYWRFTPQGVRVSKRGRLYVKAVQLAIARREPLQGRLALTVDAYPPDNRRRDLDNILKALLDAMQKAGVYEDDSQIRRIEATMHHCDSPHGRVEVSLSETGDNHA